MKHVLSAIFGAALAVGAAHAQPTAVKLTASEITQLLTGNTAIGVWEGAYRQFFGADGVTLFAQDGVRTARGEWRVDVEEDEYQSLWASDVDWEGWFIMQWHEEYYWVSRATPPTLFDVVEGQQLLGE